jgi:hypothetical protein
MTDRGRSALPGGTLIELINHVAVIRRNHRVPRRPRRPRPRGRAIAWLALMLNG